MDTTTRTGRHTLAAIEIWDGSTLFHYDDNQYAGLAGIIVTVPDGDDFITCQRFCYNDSGLDLWSASAATDDDVACAAFHAAAAWDGGFYAGVPVNDLRTLVGDSASQRLVAGNLVEIGQMYVGQ